ncbi:chromate transporter [Mycoplasma sp. P36-A1]|uniref:chromate transporter n=1 Tax=Mycoplasma sp. P36-A1 TaxID=3252900 RepID=UPI003C2C97EE
MLFDLFVSFLKIGLFCFGGGYASISLIQSEIINTHQWIDMKTFSDIITISQMTPGPIGINAATFIGINVNGLIGGVVATLGFIIPSFIIVSFLGYIYLKYGNLTIIKVVLQGLRPVIVGVIAAAGLALLVAAIFTNGVISKENFMPVQAFLFAISIYLLVKKKNLNIVVVMFSAGLINLVIVFLMKLIA